MGGILSRRGSAAQPAAPITLTEAQLLSYLQALAESTGDGICCTQPAIMEQDPFATLSLHYQTSPNLALLIAYRHHQNYGVLYYPATERIILHYTTSSEPEAWKIRIPNHLSYCRLPKIALTTPAQPMSWLITVTTWCRTHLMRHDRELLQQDYAEFVGILKKMLNTNRITLDDYVYRLVGLWQLEQPQLTNLLTAQRLFWNIYDDKRRAGCVLSKSMHRHQLHQLYNFAHPESLAILIKHLSSPTQKSVEPQLKERLGSYETKVLFRRLDFARNHDLLTFDPSLPLPAVLTTLAEQWIIKDPDASVLPWQSLRQLSAQPSYPLVIQLSETPALQNAPLARQQLWNSMLEAALLTDSPGAALLALFGGPLPLQFQLDLLFHTDHLLKPRNLLQKKGCSLSLFDFNCFTPDTFNIDTPWLGQLLEQIFKHTSFAPKTLFFWLVIRTLPKLSPETFPALAKQLITICQYHSRTELCSLRIAVVSALLMFNPDVTLPLMLQQNEAERYILDEFIISRSILNFCEHLHFPLISFFIEYESCLGEHTNRLLQIFNTSTVPAKIHDASLNLILSGNLQLPTSLAKGYCQLLLGMTTPDDKTILYVTFHFLLYCYLLVGGDNCLDALYHHGFIPAQPRFRLKISYLVNYAAEQLERAAEGMHENVLHTFCAQQMLLITDFMAFAAKLSERNQAAEFSETILALNNRFYPHVLGLPTVTLLPKTQLHGASTLFHHADESTTRPSRITFSADEPDYIPRNSQQVS